MYQFEAMDRTGQEIRDVIEAPTEEEAQNTIRQMGYFVTKLSLKKGTPAAVASGKKKRKKGFVIGGAKTKHICTFTRQLSILQDAGLPILRSLKILENNQKPGKLKFTLQDVCEDIETGMTLSEAMSKAPKVFSRLYVNMIKAGEAGGALETILQRLAEFLESAESLKRKVKGALIYPIAVVIVAVLILAGIMFFIVPTFKKMFDEFELKLPAPTLLLMAMSDYVVIYWWLMFLLPVVIWLIGKLIRKFKHGRMGYDMFIIKVPVFGGLVEKNILARTTRTLGTLVTSGVPILEAIHIARETSGNAVFENLYQKVYESIREGESIASPMKEYSKLKFHPVALFFWICLPPLVGVLIYMMKLKNRVLDDMVVNMVDVGEETGELDKMLYKIADNYDEEVSVLTEGLMSLMEPLLIICLGGMVGFIVIALFMPLISLISKLSG